jgi:hypothetical protein
VRRYSIVGRWPLSKRTPDTRRSGAWKPGGSAPGRNVRLVGEDEMVFARRRGILESAQASGNVAYFAA